jgi:hypothetical protein
MTDTTEVAAIEEVKEPSKGLIVNKQMRECLKSLELRASSELLEALHNKVLVMLIDAGNRCKANGRATVRSYDL